MKNIVRVINLVHRLVELIARGFFLLVAYISGPAECQPCITDLTLMHSASALALKIRNRQLSSEEVVKSYITRINEIQPILNCVCETRFEEALKEAKKCDELLKVLNGPSADVLAKDKPFFGVPFTTKDCIAVEGMKQTAGLVARKNYRADKDSEGVKLMRLAGGIPIATTNVSELAMWWESTNRIYGTSRNPYNTRHIVGGSSGGEGCLLAAAGSPCGIGSDIGGSIRMPSFFNGIFGHKPSKGIVSNDGQYPSAETEDQEQLLALGPMCRFAQDLAPMLQVMAHKNADMLNLQIKVDVSKLKIYYMEDDGGQLLVSTVDHEIKESMRRVVQFFKKAHNVKAKKVNIRNFKKSLALWFACMATEPGKDFAYEMANRKGRVNVLLEWLKFITFCSDHTLSALVTSSFETFNVQYGSETANKLKEECKELQQEFKDMLGDDGVFLYPTHPTAAPMHYESFVKPFNFSYTGIINVLGLPATACPLGLNKQGLPIGIQVVGGLYQDRNTLAVAEELQRAFGGWVPPEIAE
ncbi:fatty-acid amide hydrolase 2 [Phymastichus coffea]|uniref:fatty-acid amide hydrolase 2 n=1 Tax=Phymastichus coffea TaxID=108790 RepID=UPI00273B4D73|nr:fatty-acid amide hydrolase 2 [Phymastichus coffea]XP_058799095.1 fatty-acid amide hydrolase 2 [Phymastichus coffea]XP_058799096.1 fatty-acid amide hydrolase 2 [Phymastichus coffea]